MPEPDGPRVHEVDALFRRLAQRASIVGAGVTGLRNDALNVPPVERLLGSLGL
jgi:hypothetical protein